jgi:uncharacterized DUF497 family protein
MEFSWDPKKAASNLKDHKVSFEEAATIFGDVLAITFNDPDHSVGEHRLLTFGISSEVDSWSFPIPSVVSITQLISARLATRRERKIYEEG